MARRSKPEDSTFSLIIPQPSVAYKCLLPLPAPSPAASGLFPRAVGTLRRKGLPPRESTTKRMILKLGHDLQRKRIQMGNTNAKIRKNTPNEIK